MEIQEQVPLSSLTTFKVGGAAQYVIHCGNVEDIKSALAFAGERALPWYVLGGGSNVLASDEGYAGVIIQPMLTGIRFEEGMEETHGNSSSVSVTAAAGEAWDPFVQACVGRELWGLENLAGIPGLVGGAPIQNIGAYGADVSQTISLVEALDTVTGEIKSFSNAECAFGYRDSIFKRTAQYIVLRVIFSLSKNAAPHTSYADLTVYQEKNGPLSTPQEIAAAVREIRARKFPDLRVSGTAGSFFKNPFITQEHYDVLLDKYPELPGFPVEIKEPASTSSEARAAVKIPLAWILDKVLDLRGHALGPVRLFEQQPLVVVAEKGATAHDVDVLGKEIEKKVFDATQIVIEREVRML